MSSYLAFDLGASSGRAIIGRLENGRLELTEVHRFANGPLRQGDAIYWDFPALVNELEIGLGKALAVDKSISAIGIDTWGVDYVFFDNATGEARRLPYHYRDDRTFEATRKVWSRVSADELYKATGIQCMSLNTVYQLAAHLEQHPEDFENSHFLTMPDALAFALGGDDSAEYTHCSTTNLLDPASRNWDWELIDKLGLPRAVFPKIVSPCSFGGAISERLQKKFGCGAIPIVKVGSHDTASAVAAVPAPETGKWAYISAGTWALLGAELDEPFITAESCRQSFTNEGGLDGKIRFLTNIMGSWLFQESRRVWNETGRNYSFTSMEEDALKTTPFKFLLNPNDATFAPPGDMPGRIMDFCERTGQGTPSHDSEITRAIYDSLAFYFKNKLETLEQLLGCRYACLNVVGGGTKAELLMQLTADALGIPVVAGPVEATAVGNLLAQAIALREVDDLAAARRVVKASFDVKTYAPRAEMTAKFAAESGRFAQLAK
ncbi:MAG: FGGY-family carbohydrate kinase [Victivallaceae bacterium]|nr:FGGY-family carbohydrate kinase [Victivallaceae bacterium]